MKKLWKDGKSLRDNLKKRLPKLTAEYFAEGRVALAPGTSWHDMHQFRLATKRFRYTLETFQPAYGPGIKVRIELLKQVQTFLGDINDCIVTSAMLEPMPGTEDLRATLAERADSKTKKLRSFWMREFDAPGRESQWLRYVRGYVCRPRPLPRSHRLPRPAEVVS